MILRRETDKCRGTHKLKLQSYRRDESVQLKLFYRERDRKLLMDSASVFSERERKTDTKYYYHYVYYVI